MQIGDTIWRFDENRRVYGEPEPGRIWASGGPIYREHRRPCMIVGESTRSWLVGPGYKPWKVPKAGEHHGWCFSEAEVDDQCWLNEHRYRIEKAVGILKDAAVLRQVAELIGWKPDVRG